MPVGYDELSKEQYIGGVYLREFLRAPQSQLRSTEKFVEVRSQANTSKHKHKQYLSCARLGMSTYTKTHQFTKTGSGQT